MKIIELANTVLKQTVTSNQQKNKENFAQWLNSPTKQSTGDEYYWQHQQQLQPSDLSFKTCLSKAKEKPAKLVEANNQQRLAHNVSNIADKEVPANLSPPPIKKNQPINYSDFSKKALQQILSDLKRNSEQIALNQEPSPVKLTEIFASKTPNKIPFGSSTLPPIFKHHQLHIANGQAELALSTTQLTNQQTGELIQFIKQWFANKGIRLQQITINGVKQ